MNGKVSSLITVNFYACIPTKLLHSLTVLSDLYDIVTAFARYERNNITMLLTLPAFVFPPARFQALPFPIPQTPEGLQLSNHGA